MDVRDVDGPAVPAAGVAARYGVRREGILRRTRVGDGAEVAAGTVRTGTASRLLQQRPAVHDPPDQEALARQVAVEAARQPVLQQEVLAAVGPDQDLVALAGGPLDGGKL